MISSLPEDILIQIFQVQNNIQDCLHLGRCSQRLFSILDRHRLPIIRQVILQSNHHKHDIQLCYFLDAYWTWAQDFLDDPCTPYRQIPTESHPPPARFDTCRSAVDLTDRHVWDIVARWQGLYLLFDLYLTPSLHTIYCGSALPYRYSNEPNADYEKELSYVVDVQHEHSRKAPSHGFHDISADDTTSNHQHAAIFERFYTALTGYWLCCAAMHLASIGRYELQTEENRTWDFAYSLPFDQASVSEALHVIEVYDFVYGFLLPQVQLVRADKFMQWTDGRNYNKPTESLESNRSFLLAHTRYILSPPDIIELLILTSSWKETSNRPPEWTPNEKSAYLKLRLLFDDFGFPGQVRIRDCGETPETHLSILDLEKWVESKLHEESGSRGGDLWKIYRKTKWVDHSRGKILIWAISDDTVVDHIQKV